MKIFSALLSCLLLGSSVPVEARMPYQHDSSAIVKVDCSAGRGSATKVGPRTYISVSHVVSLGGCTVSGQPIKVTYNNKEKDFAVFIGPEGPGYIPVSCAGFRMGEAYIMRGYAGGGTANFFQPVIAITRDDKFTLFVGEDFPGMSGGPIIDKKGRVTGTVNIAHPTGGVDLRTTIICKS